MTPEERAEKIVEDIGYNPNWGRKNIVNYYAAEIRKAVEEAIMTEQMRQEQSEIEKINRAVEEYADLQNRTVTRSNKEWSLSVKQGKAEAYEDAARIAESVRKDWEDHLLNTGEMIDQKDFIAKQLRARAKGIR